MFHHFCPLRAQLSCELCENCSERFYKMLVYDRVPELAYECQGQGQVRSTMVIMQKMRKRKRVTHLLWAILTYTSMMSSI